MKKRNFLSYRAAIFAMALVLLAILLLLALVAASVMSISFVIILAAGVLLLTAIMYSGYRFIYIPYRETERMLELFMDGFTTQDIYSLRFPLTYGMDGALRRLKDILDTSELITSSRRQAQYLALQNQINPHFLYNTLEGIRGEAITAGLDNVAQMTEALATFFRYTISNVDQLVTLEDELDNIQNYYTIQQYRFGDRIRLSVVYDAEDRDLLYKCRLPKITLQPVMENAIIHGLERKMGGGLIQIKLTATAERLIINVADNGLGMEEARLKELNKKLQTPFFRYENPDAGGGIAVVNVNNRIQLLFGEEYGITIYSTLGAGTNVEITLPLMTTRDGGLTGSQKNVRPEATNEIRNHLL